MQGPIENALIVTAAVNEFLAGRDIRGFWPNAPTFRFLKVFEFRAGPSPGDATAEYPLVASDPVTWAEWLKPWCRGLRLHHAPRPTKGDRLFHDHDRMLVGLVGGGPRWFIEAVGEVRSQFWEGYHRLGDRNDPDRRIWLCTNLLIAEVATGEVEPQHLATAVAELSAILPEIEEYALAERDARPFAPHFARARDALSGRPTDDPAWMNGNLSFTCFDDRQLAVLRAIQHAWVYGGMGSWNDGAGSGERYETLSARLFTALLNATCGLANSTYRG